MNTTCGRVNFKSDVLSNTSSRITFTGPGRVELIAPQQLSGQIYLKDSWIRITDDAALGKMPDECIPDAIILDGGTLQNGRYGSESFVGTNRGITVTAAGGYLMAGYSGITSGLGILSPITGPGSISVKYESSAVRLYNSQNSWTGDTIVGAIGTGASYGFTAVLITAADGVIPHGEGKGVLRVAPLASYGNQYRSYHGPQVSGAIVNLQGHRQEVNAVYGNPRSVLSSPTAGGTLVLGGTSDSDWRGTVDDSVIIEKTGSGTLRLDGALFNGTLALSNGIAESGAANFSPTGRVILAGGTLRFIPPAGLRFWSSKDMVSEPDYCGYAFYPQYGNESSLALLPIKRAVYTGMWNVPENGIYSFRKNFSGTASLKIDGETVLSGSSVTVCERVNDIAVSAGAHRIELAFSWSGIGAMSDGFPCGIIYDPGNGDFETSEERNRARMFADNGSREVVAAGGSDIFYGIMHVMSNTTVIVDNTIEPFGFGGLLTTPSDDPATVTFDIRDGKPLLFGGTSLQTPAVLDAPILCESGISFTNHVWLRREIPGGASLAPDTTLTFDYDGAPSGSETLSDYSLHLSADRPGDTITVPAGKTLTLDSTSYTEDGFIDPVNAVRRFTVNVVLEGGELIFMNAGTIDFTGTVSGSGTIRKISTGDVFFSNGSGLSSETDISIESGRFCIPSSTSIGAAQITLAGGRIMPFHGASLSFPDNITFRLKSGGFETSTAEETITVEGPMIHITGDISTWGPGTVRIAGTSNNDIQIFVRDGNTLALANTADSYAVGSLTCCLGSTVRLEGQKQIPTSGSLTLSGGTLDMNGNDLCVSDLFGNEFINIVTNSTATPSVLTTLSAKTNVWNVIFTGQVKVQMGGPGTVYISSATLNNTGLSVTNGTVRYTDSPSVKCNLLRLTVTKTRPARSGPPDYANTGCQFSDLFLYLNGTKLDWPAGATAQADSPEVTSSENASKVLDGNSATKWYSKSKNIPLTINTGDAISFDAYAFRTANDAIGRDPVSWKLEFGQIVNNITNWFQIDEKTDMTNAIPLTRYALSDQFSIQNTFYSSMAEESYDVNITKPGVLELSGIYQTFHALTGTGTLIGTNRANIVIGGASSFCGTIAATEPVSLKFDGAVIPAIIPARGTRLVNNGSEGCVTYSTNAFISGTFADGSTPLGLTIAEGAVNLSGTSGGWTGPTTIASDSELSVSVGLRARYFRFTILNCTGNNGMRNAQLSEIRLLRNGSESPWPAGTTVSSSGTASERHEGEWELIDGKVNTKCYWEKATAPVLITVPKDIIFDGYDWYSANDLMSIRQPVSWRFEISINGIDWTEIDAPIDAPTRSVGSQSLSYSWTTPEISDIAKDSDCLSDVSPHALATNGRLILTHVNETFGPLSGTGTVLLENDAKARVATGTPATFAGTISGKGSFIKTGQAEQILSGTITCGELVVEDGILNLTGASLAGVTNIILRGGAVIGVATVTGDLTVTFAGGAYGAELAVSGHLALTATDGVQAKILTGFKDKTVHGIYFTFSSTDDHSRALIHSLTAEETIPAGWSVIVGMDAGTMRYSVSRCGTVILLR